MEGRSVGSGFEGVVEFACREDADEGWVDVSQDGRTTLKSSAHSGKAGCPGVRKSLRFALNAGKVTIEISRAPGPQIKLGLLKAE